MGDTGCLMQPFCYASGLSNEANQSNPIHALGQSISFGRFMSESLSWEKWSSFSHNRYVEEAERYSRPGSVAQKKAFFEAHYKRLAAQRAAALLEQQANDAASNNVTHQEREPLPDNNHNSQTTSPNVKPVVNDKKDFKIPNSNRDPSMTKIGTENQPSVGKSVKVESQSQLRNVDFQREVSEKVRGTPPVKTATLKQNSKSNKENLASMIDKKPPVSSLSKLLKATETSKFTSSPVKSAVSVCSPKKDNFATPTSKKPALGSPERKRSSPKSLHMSNFTPIRELNRLTASVMKRFENARVGAASSKVSKDGSLTPLRTPIAASKNEGQKHSSMTPLTENKRIHRTKTPIDLSASGSKISGNKWHLLSAEKKMRSPVISSPFNLRTEERAARRKKKLEEKFNAGEAQKVQLHTKLKEKANTEIRKLRQSFCFRARPLPEFYQERKESKEEKDKGIWTQVESPKQGRKAIQTPLPPQKDSARNNGVKGGSGTPTHPQFSNSPATTRIHRQIFSKATKTKDDTK